MAERSRDWSLDRRGWGHVRQAVRRCPEKNYVMAHGSYSLIHLSSNDVRFCNPKSNVTSFKDNCMNHLLTASLFLRRRYLTTTKTSMHIISPRNMPHACKKGWEKLRYFPSVLSDVIVSAHLEYIITFSWSPFLIIKCHPNSKGNLISMLPTSPNCWLFL